VVGDKPFSRLAAVRLPFSEMPTLTIVPNIYANPDQIKRLAAVLL